MIFSAADRCQERGQVAGPRGDALKELLELPKEPEILRASLPRPREYHEINSEEVLAAIRNF